MVIAAVPLATPEVAVMVTDPLVTAVTRPADETVATPASEDDHVTVASGITDPSSSFTVALNATVSPRDDKELVLGETSTVDGAWPTVTEAVPVAEPEVPVIVALPSATEVTKPTDETVAIPVSDEVQVTVAPDITLPDASLTVAVKVAVSANEANERLVGDSVTEEAT